MRYFTVNWGCRVHFAAALIFRSNVALLREHFHHFHSARLVFSLSYSQQHTNFFIFHSEKCGERNLSPRRRWHIAWKREQNMSNSILPLTSEFIVLFTARRVARLLISHAVEISLLRKSSEKLYDCDIASESSLSLENGF